MGDRIKENAGTIIAILCGALFMILIPILINFINQKIKEYNCDHISITEAWKDQECREYFDRTMGD